MMTLFYSMAYDADGNEITSIVLTTDENGKASTDNEQFLMPTVTKLMVFCHMRLT